MQITYIVTKNFAHLPKDAAIAMIDGTVPGWTPRDEDLHYDHHKPGGGKVQIDELPNPPANGNILQLKDSMDATHPTRDSYWGTSPWCIATTLCDADACVAAAWLQLEAKDLTPETVRRLRAIALDCDYLCIPPSEPEQDLAEFASKAVAALKESSKSLPAELGLPDDRKTWTEEQQVQYASEAFKRGTEWLIAAVKGERPYPGESGEADAYFEAMQKDIDALRQLKAVRLINGAAYLDMRSLNKYIDPRCLTQIAKEMGADKPITLTSRSMNVHIGEDLTVPGCQYTLGSLTYHAAAPNLDLTKIFPELAKLEADRRDYIGFRPAKTTWGGRAAVGGSGFNDASLLSPEEVIRFVLEEIADV